SLSLFLFSLSLGTEVPRERERKREKGHPRCPSSRCILSLSHFLSLSHCSICGKKDRVTVRYSRRGGIGVVSPRLRVRRRLQTLSRLRHHLVHRLRDPHQRRCQQDPRDQLLRERATRRQHHDHDRRRRAQPDRQNTLQRLRDPVIGHHRRDSRNDHARRDQRQRRTHLTRKSQQFKIHLDHPSSCPRAPQGPVS